MTNKMTPEEAIGRLKEESEKLPAVMDALRRISEIVQQLPMKAGTEDENRTQVRQ